MGVIPNRHPLLLRTQESLQTAHIRLFLQVEGSFLGRPVNKSPAILGSISGRLIFGNSHVSVLKQEAPET